MYVMGPHGSSGPRVHCLYQPSNIHNSSSLANQLLTNSAFYKLQLSISVSSIILHGKNDSPCEKEAGYPVNSVMTNFRAKAMNSIAKATNSIAKVRNSIAKAMNSTANRTNSIAKVTTSIAKMTNSIAKTSKLQSLKGHICINIYLLSLIILSSLCQTVLLYVIF